MRSGTKSSTSTVWLANAGALRSPLMSIRQVPRGTECPNGMEKTCPPAISDVLSIRVYSTPSGRDRMAVIGSPGIA